MKLTRVQKNKICTPYRWCNNHKSTIYAIGIVNLKSIHAMGA
jgi:hypothetical protein